jgi:hypothetical protein
MNSAFIGHVMSRRNVPIEARNGDFECAARLRDCFARRCGT